MNEQVCTPEWEPDAVYFTGLLFQWRCACGAESLASYIGRENAHGDFVAHVLKRRGELPR